MILAKIRVSKTYAKVISLESIPAGIVGAQVQIEYADSAWNALNKTVVFHGAQTKDVVDAGELVTIPAEAVSKAGAALYLGIYGTDGESGLVIPTLWADLGRVRASADPCGDDTTDPQLPVWAQLEQRIDILEDHTDPPLRGVDYWTEADREEILQELMIALGTPIFGTVEADNTITLTGALTDGTYTLKYEDREGNVTEIGDITVESKEPYTNLLPLAIDSDGNPYNGGLGWKAGYRLNTSAVETAYEATCVTGFIPVTNQDTVYFSKITWPYDGEHAGKCYFCLYDSSFTKVTGQQMTVDMGHYGVSYDEGNSPVSIDLAKWMAYYGYTTEISYLRLSAVEISGESIITANEPIE